MEKIDANEFNTCFNDIQLKATNELRYQHNAEAVKVDKKLAGAVNKALTELTDAELDVVEKCWSVWLGASVAANCEGDGKACKGLKYFKDDTHATCKIATKLAISVYKETDKTKLEEFRTKGRATDETYKTEL
jgi:hypothetical protein